MSASNPADTAKRATPSTHAALAEDFDTRHEDDLSVKRFTLTQGKLVLIPLVTMGLGGLIGYHTLGKPLTKMFPRFFEGVDTTKKTAETIRDAVTGKEGKKWNLNAAKWIGAGAMGMVGSTLGSIFVGYDKWHKEESTRLAAEEIEHDISRMELFRPSDRELVAENKRLRSMLEEKESVRPHHASPTALGGARPQHRVEDAVHFGKHQSHEQQLG